MTFNKTLNIFVMSQLCLSFLICQVGTQIPAVAPLQRYGKLLIEGCLEFVFKGYSSVLGCTSQGFLNKKGNGTWGQT